MRTYVITNLKGGVGKTTSAVNIGYNMAVLGRKVLMIDADPQTNLTPFFTKANPNGRTLKDIFHHPDKIRNIICRSRYENIDIIKGCTSLKEADPIGEMVLAEALQLVDDRYDICIIDTRPAIENITRNALQAGDVLLTPVLLDKFCRDNLLLLEDELHDLQHSYGFEWFIFANKVVNKRSQRDTYRDMVERHEWKFLESCIGRSAVVENALEYYKPLLRHRRNSAAAMDYMELTRELLEV